ncbi:MAG: thioredoxin-disulfide reductase [Bdellovibrionales bacterium]|nr:thioredoxin-disulfide reductase [Bdellovibrionales bacterium]
MNKNQDKPEVRNITIIGSGPAGLTAAIYAARANLSPLLIEGDESGGQLMTTTEVENYPGFAKGIMGPELMLTMREQALRFGTEIISKHVTQVDFSKQPLQVKVDNQLYLSQSVIISTGASAKYLGLSAEKKFLGRGVSACATCDGAFFKNANVAVVGGGDTAMEEAHFLTRFAKKVWLIHRRDQFKASKIMADRVLGNPKIEVIWNSAVLDIVGNQVVESLRLTNVQTKVEQDLPVEGVFIAIGHKPNTDLFKGQLEMNEVGYLITKAKSTATSIPGVFAAGDVQDPIYRQAITAAGTGCMAALDAEKWLERQEPNGPK